MMLIKVYKNKIEYHAGNYINDWTTDSIDMCNSIVHYYTYMGKVVRVDDTRTQTHAVHFNS